MAKSNQSEKDSIQARKTLNEFEEIFIDPKFQQKIMKGYADPIIEFVNKSKTYSGMLKTYQNLYDIIDDKLFFDNFYSMDFVESVHGANAIQVESYANTQAKAYNDNSIYAADPPENMTAAELIEAFTLKPKKAIKYFESKGVKLSTGWIEAMKVSNNHAFTIANVTKLDMLYDVKKMILNALENGQPIGEFKKDFRGLLQKHGWYDDPKDKSLDTNWRINLIVVNNTNTAYAAGRLQQSLDGSKRFPYIKFVVTLDPSTTDSCRYLGVKKIVMRLDDNQLKNFYPMRHHRCRTDALPINDDILKLRSLKVIKGISIIKYKNEKGFQTLPNIPFEPDLTEYPNELSDKYTPPN